MTDRMPTLQRMQTLAQQWTEQSDRRAIFLDCYRLMTSNMLASIEAGEFHDPAWVRALLDRFADYYFDALLAYEQADPAAPPVWRITHNAARSRRTHVLQNLLLGVNAHINYDLVLALADVLTPEWAELTEEQRRERYQDHCRINDIIAGTVDAVQDDVVERYAPLMDIVDKLLGSLDEWLIASLLSSWREEVWHHAMTLLSTTAPPQREALVRQIEDATLGRAQGILLRQKSSPG